MRRFFVLVGTAWLGLLAFSACGNEDSSDLFGKPDAGGSAGKGGTGGTGAVDGGTCAPGAKSCPNEKGELVCLTSNDPEHGCKGSTGCVACALPSAKAKCSDAGSCAIDACNPLTADCNANPLDGCEVNLQTDVAHCGDCATDCQAVHGAGWICKAGSCELNECCPTGDPSCLSLRDCDGDKANGCEVDTASDAKNCSACGSVCDLPNAKSDCAASTCAVVECHAGWADCDGNPSNGCETNTVNDAGNCGGCAQVCNSDNGTKACVGGSCEISCFAGFGNCDGDAGKNGCETNLDSDPLNCKSCKVKCNPANAAAATCVSGNCGYSACNSGFADCDGNKANGCEINTSQDKDHCGTCSTKCVAPSGGTVVCSNGTCSQSCAPLTDCAGVCVNVGNDVKNCGGCGTVCTPPANATAKCTGSCGFTCNNGYATCGQSQCFDIQNDPDHCGAGCTDCLGPSAGFGAPTCGNATCGFTCTNPTPNKCGSGCYDNQTDPNHCGPSCKVCPGPTSGTGTPACVAGTCGITCSGTTPTKCGTDCVNTQTDKQHCGGCSPCHASASGCVAGQCTCSSGSYCSSSIGCKACCTPLAQDTCANFSTCCSDFVCRDCCTPGGQGGAGNSCSSTNTCCSDNVCRLVCS